MMHSSRNNNFNKGLLNQANIYKYHIFVYPKFEMKEQI